MKITTEHLRQTAAQIKSNSLSYEDATLLYEIINNNQASALLEELIDMERRKCGDETSTISKIMSTLELLADKYSGVACTLMCQLWSIANDRFMHETCNSIDLWVTDCDESDFVFQLRKFAESEPDLNVREHFRHLLENKKK